MIQGLSHIVLQSLLLTIIILPLISISEAQVMSSPGYQLQSDSVNFGGGLSSSTNFVQESTLGEVATGPSDSSNFSLRAGYQQMQEIFISLDVSGDVVMSPDIPGLTGGTSNGSTTFTVITDNPAGYQLLISAETNPAMQGSFDTIEDYDAGIDPDFSFITGSEEALFGFTPEGVDITSEFIDDGATCGNAGSDTPLACWDGLDTTDRVIAEATGGNQPSGATTTVHFRVGVGSTAGVISGVYTATSTVTALPL
jgi:hypothetical protein